jgi:hypothetical protein
VAETSFPVAGGAGVTDAAYERLMGPITGSGRYAFGPTTSQITTPLIFGDNSGRQVKAYANQSAIVRGFRWESGTTPPVLALDANTSGNPRIDLIVLRLNRADFTVRLGKTNGTPATVPTAPAPVQDPSTTGVWELPVATVKVASSGTTGQPFIQTTDVTATDWWLAPPSYVLRDGSYLPTAVNGALVHRIDNGRTYRGVGSGYALLGEAGAETKITVAGGWTSDFIYAQRVNGWTNFRASVVLNVADRPASTALTVCALPSGFLPSRDVPIVCYLSPNQIAYATVDSTSGSVVVDGYGAVFPKGGKLIIPATSWPST